MSSAPTEPTANLTDAARRLLAARQNLVETSSSSAVHRNASTGAAPLLELEPTVSAITIDSSNNNPHQQEFVPPDPPTMKRQIDALASQNAEDNLDMKFNDNAYHVIANIIADKLEYQKQSSTSEEEADEVMNSLLPRNLQVTFAEATQYRLMQLASSGSDGNVDLLGGGGATDYAPGSVEDLVQRCKDFQPTKVKVAPHTPSMPTPATGRYQPPRSLSGSNSVSGTPSSRVSEAHAASVQSKARQQLMAEIEESKRLMDSATTEEAAMFWSKHLDVLYASLGRLQGSEDASKQNQLSPHRGQKKISDPGAPTNIGGVPAKKVWVIAPANLPGGYRFEAQLDDRKFLATVPPGGVVKGQTFLTEYRDLDRVIMSVPVGHWRDGIFDCLNAGVCHPFLLTTLFCPLIALGQVMTRNRLTWTGGPGPLVETRMTFTSMWIILSSYIVLNIVFISLPMTKESPFVDSETGDLDWMAAGPVVALNVGFVLYIILAVCRTRSSIKKKFMITDGSCGDLEDLCYAVICQPCAICQLGRHTADYSMFRATCCSNTGLPAKVECPDGPVTENMGMYGGDKGQNLV